MSSMFIGQNTALHIAVPALAISIGLIAFVIGKVVYRLFLHPLAGQPGPFLAKCTSWYAAYHSWRGTIHLDITRCHEVYGDVVRYRPNGIVFNNIEAQRDIYMNSATINKSRGYHEFRQNGSFSIISAYDRVEHAPRRKLLSHAFSTLALGNYAPVVTKTAKIFCDSLLGDLDGSSKESEWSPARDVGLLSSYFTYDVMSEVVFYSPQNLMTETHGRSAITGINSAMVLVGIALEQFSFAGSTFLKSLLLRKHVKNGKTFISNAKELAIKRVVLEQERHIDDIFGRLLGQVKGDTGLSMQELAADAGVIIVAGTDTTAVSISAFLFYLSRNPTASAKLSAEIHSTFPTVDAITSGPELNSCVYLRACIDEALRLAPPVAAPLWRELMAPQTISGVSLPAGTEVSTCAYTLQRKPTYFSSPNTFVPERWLPDFETDIPVDLSRKAFIPFSIGHRGCIGKNLAYMELMTALAQIVYRAEWKKADGPEGERGETTTGGEKDFSLRAHFTSHVDGPFLQFKDRV